LSVVTIALFVATRSHAQSAVHSNYVGVNGGGTLSLGGGLRRSRAVEDDRSAVQPYAEIGVGASIPEGGSWKWIFEIRYQFAASRDLLPRWTL